MNVVGYEYMTEESDSDSSSVVRQQWRSSGIVTLLTMRNPCYNLYTELDKFTTSEQAGRSGQFKEYVLQFPCRRHQKEHHSGRLKSMEVHGSRTQDRFREASVGANARRSISFTADDILSDMDSD